MKKLQDAPQGTWTLPDYPAEIMANGMPFQRAKLQQPYPNVVAQYRQKVVKNSVHLLVYNNGVWVMDHVDSENPDLGNPFVHFLNDHPAGAVVKGAAAVAGVAAVFVGVGKLLEEVLA